MSTQPSSNKSMSLFAVLTGLAMFSLSGPSEVARSIQSVSQSSRGDLNPATCLREKLEADAAASCRLMAEDISGVVKIVRQNKRVRDLDNPDDPNAFVTRTGWKVTVDINPKLKDLGISQRDIENAKDEDQDGSDYCATCHAEIGRASDVAEDAAAALKKAREMVREQTERVRSRVAGAQEFRRRIDDCETDKKGKAIRNPVLIGKCQIVRLRKIKDPEEAKTFFAEKVRPRLASMLACSPLQSGSTLSTGGLAGLGALSPTGVNTFGGISGAGGLNGLNGFNGVGNASAMNQACATSRAAGLQLVTQALQANQDIPEVTQTLSDMYAFGAVNQRIQELNQYAHLPENHPLRQQAAEQLRALYQGWAQYKQGRDQQMMQSTLSSDNVYDSPMGTQVAANLNMLDNEMASISTNHLALLQAGQGNNPNTVNTNLAALNGATNAGQANTPATPLNAIGNGRNERGIPNQFAGPLNANGAQGNTPNILQNQPGNLNINRAAPVVNRPGAGKLPTFGSSVR